MPRHTKAAEEKPVVLYRRVLAEAQAEMAELKTQIKTLNKMIKEELKKEKGK